MKKTDNPPLKVLPGALADRFSEACPGDPDAFFFFKTPIGLFRGVSSEDWLFELRLMDFDSETKMALPASSALQHETEQQFKAYFDGKLKRFDLPLALHTLSPFARSVTEHLLRVAFGELTTYKELACLVGKPEHARAVGAVMARNAWLVAVPCHRVLHSSGSISGFSAPGGTQTKAWLLRHEGHHIENDKITGKRTK